MHADTLSSTASRVACSIAVVGGRSAHASTASSRLSLHVLARSDADDYFCFSGGASRDEQVSQHTVAAIGGIDAGSGCRSVGRLALRRDAVRAPGVAFILSLS